MPSSWARRALHSSDCDMLYLRTYDMKIARIAKIAHSSVKIEPGRNAGLYFFLIWDIFFLLWDICMACSI
jgi:hypothetical protein